MTDCWLHFVRSLGDLPRCTHPYVPQPLCLLYLGDSVLHQGLGYSCSGQGWRSRRCWWDTAGGAAVAPSSN